MIKIADILQRMGISDNNKLYFNFKNDPWEKCIPYRLKKGLDEIAPEGLLISNNKVICLFFDCVKNTSFNLKPTFKKIWNLGGVPTIFIINPETIDIYNGFSFNTRDLLFDKLEINNIKIDFNNINHNYSIWDIFSGRLVQDKYRSQVDKRLLDNLEQTKNLLEKKGLTEEHSQSIIGRLLFSRYLLDRGVQLDNTYFNDKKSFLDLIKDKNRLYKYFNYLKDTFNGDLFPVTITEKENVNETHLFYLYELFSGSTIQESYIQKSLFDLYDFNIIPIELISEVYERFMGHSKKKKQAAYYTPAFLVDYILEKTVKKHLLIEEECRIFDPSCGSGIFLVESLRYLIEKHININGFVSEEKLKKILVNNIFGTDIDENAVNLTIFSLCLTILDYIEPKDITKFRFPSLKNNNIFRVDFFDCNHNFNRIIGNLDFILGNPPWDSSSPRDSLHYRYILQNNIPISDKQIAQSFLIRTRDFSCEKTKCALVLPSKPFFYNPISKKFREYWLKHFMISEILELSPVRNEIFQGASAPTALIFFQNNSKTLISNNIIKHTSIKSNVFLKALKLIVIEKNDIKYVKQSLFQEYDWLWKVMLYGNLLDFHLLKKLKDNNKNINQIIKDNNLLYGEGFTKKGPKQGNKLPDDILNKTYLDTKKKALTRYYINNTNLINYSDKCLLYRKGKEGIFKAPFVLLKKGFKREDFSSVAAYTDHDYVFTNSITAIKGNNDQKELLKCLTGFFNSDFFRYYLLMQGSSAGVEREQGNNKKDRFTAPISISKNISTIVDTIQDLLQKKKDDFIFGITNDIENQIKIKEKELSALILNEFELTIIEKSLVDYALEITIPQINNDKKVYQNCSNDQLLDYASTFYEHFTKRWSGNPEYFCIDIFYSRNIIAMNFKIELTKPSEFITITKLDNLNNLDNLIKLGEEKITDKFYEQRDIRGFNEDSFYILKSNQYKNWHKLIANIDLLEFIEAMLTAENESI